MAADVLNFCSQCGARLPGEARFCPGCGRTLADTPPAAGATPRGWREQIPGLVVLGTFLAIGLVVWVTVLQSGASSSTAPRPPGPPSAAGGAGLPADHPPIGLSDEAKQILEQLTAKAAAAPTDVQAWKTLAQVQARAAQVDPAYGARAVDAYRHLQSLTPDDLDVVRELANVYFDQQAYDDAVKQYERYLESKPDDPSVRTDLGTAQLYQQQVDRAVETYHQVIAAHPDFLQAHFNLGLAYEAKGDREQALASIARARSLAKDDTTRQRIDRVVAEVTGAAAPGADASAAGGGMPPGESARPPGGPGHPPVAGGGKPPGGPGHPPIGAAGAPGAGTAGAPPPPHGTDYRSEVEAALRAHPILGSKITAIEWPDDTRARVLVSDFPMQSMPDFARNLFKARLETIIHDAKETYGVTGERAIELVDAGNGTTMERAAQ